MVFEECEIWDDDDGFEEDTHSIWMTHNEIMFLDDSLTMMLEKDGMSDGVTTMRGVMASAHLPAPVSLLDKIGMAVLQVTDPETKEKGTTLKLCDSDIYMLREICHSYCKVGKEPVGYNLKRKLYLSLYGGTFEKDKIVDNLLATVDLDIKEPAPKLDK